MNKKISQLNEASSVGINDLIPIVQNNETKKVKKSNFETDPVVGAINGIIKADGDGNISRAMEFIDYSPSMDFASLAVNAWQPATEYEYLDIIYTGISNIDPAWGNYGILYFCCKENHTSSSNFALDLNKWSFVFLNANTIAYIGGIAKSDGAGNLSQAVSGFDYLAPNGISGSFTTNDGKTITIINGLVTSIVED